MRLHTNTVRGPAILFAAGPHDDIMASKASDEHQISREADQGMVLSVFQGTIESVDLRVRGRRSRTDEAARRGEGGMVAVDVLDRGAVHLCALEFPSRKQRRWRWYRSRPGITPCVSRFADRAVGLCCWRPSAADRLAGLLTEDRFIGHGARLYAISG